MTEEVLLNVLRTQEVMLNECTGYTGGLIVKQGIFAQPDVLFKDDDHFHDVVARYPESYIDMDKKD